jgi:tetratricopeptide (TPR) repeat protein
MMFYVRKFFVPWPLGIDYGRTPEHERASTTIWWAWTIPAAMLGMAWFWRRRWPIAAAGILIFFVAALPNSGLVPFEYQYVSTTADRYVYLSMLGAGMVVGCLVKSAPSGSAMLTAGGRPLRRVIVGVALMASLVVTELQIRVWWDGQTLFRHAIAVNPQSWMSRSNLGMILEHSDPGEAIVQCRLAVELNPKGWVAHNNLAAVLSTRDADAAIVQGQLAVTLNPEYADAYNNLGVAYTRKGDSKNGLAAFERAHQLAPDNAIIGENYRRAAAGEFAATRRAE